MQESLRLDLWAEAHLSSIHAKHISGAANVRANSLSHTPIDQAEWNLYCLLFRDLTTRFVEPAVDLFTSGSNHQLPCLFSHFPTPGAEAVDALHSPWPLGLLLYAFPPLPLIGKVIRKLLEEKTELLLLAPHWLHQPWFADLISLSIAPLWRIPDNWISLLQGPLVHPDPQSAGRLEIERFLLTEALISLDVIDII